MDFSLLTLEIFTVGFFAFAVLAFVAFLKAGKERTEDMSREDAAFFKPVRRCYECLATAGSRDVKSTTECASACGAMV